nr:type II toxin-antitoxin system VapC family toxin [Spirochaetaceae bacterium]
MTTAVDTSVLLDILVDDKQYAATSEATLARARAEGRLIVCESVVAELRPALQSDDEVFQFFDDLGIEFLPSSLESAILAGNTYTEYLKNRGSVRRVLPDFLIAAHARCFADRLLARDRGYYRNYFKDLIILY